MGALIGVTASEFLALLTIIFVYNRYRPSIRRHIEQSAPYAPAPIAKNLILLAVPITLGASISSLSGMVDSAMIIRILLQGYRPDRLLPAALQRDNTDQHARRADHGSGHEPRACHIRKRCPQG